MPFLWEQNVTNGKLNEHADQQRGTLARLRRAADAEPGSAPDLWPVYTQLDSEGRLTRRLRAEHICLVTYGVHQQGQQFSVHQQGRPLGRALRDLVTADRFSEEAVNRRVNQLATAQPGEEWTHHMIALVGLMRATKRPIGFDYTQLFWDLVNLQDELKAPGVRRRLGAAYFRSSTTNKPKE